MVNKLKYGCLSLMLLLAFAPSAFAREFFDIYSECGLGALIAPKNETIAIVTNVTWDSGTTAVSSNVSSPDTCKGKKARTASLIVESYDQLASDLSSGNGKYLDSLALVTGCKEASQQAFKDALRVEFASIVAQPSYSNQTRVEKSEALYNAVTKLVDGGSPSVSCGVNS